MISLSATDHNFTILVIGPKGPTGGIARYVKDVTSSLCGCRWVLFDTSRPPKAVTTEHTVGYGELLNAGFRRALQGVWVTLRHVMHFPFVLVRTRPDAVLITGTEYWTFWENAVYLLWCRLFRYPVVMHYLGAFDQYYEASSPIAKALIIAVLRQPKGLLLLSARVANIVRSILPHARIQVIPSSVDVSRFQVENTSHMDAATMHSDIVRVGFMGGSDPYRKGIADLISAIPLVVRDCPNVRFVLAGGPNVQKMAELCISLRLDHLVIFPGWISNVADFYQHIDLLVLPSYNEGLPYVIIEAMAAGLPVVASDVGGIPEVVQHGENGYLIKPGDISSLAHWIVELSRSSSLRRSIALVNARKAKDVYSLEKAIGGIHQSIRDAISAQSGQA